MKTFERDVADLLNDGSIRVLIYNGDADVMCNWSGGLAWTRELEWKCQDEFNAAEEHAFVLAGQNNSPVGTVWTVGSLLTFVRVFNAGHFAPMDQPAVALEMINRFLKNEEL
ncbi:hypothetical protein BBJ28_00026534 [Nothophytophthora sp. Chile5]|nr:hypothetical protein BBJ28_00026534 [Nothophytophthora sp. Chile5]